MAERAVDRLLELDGPRCASCFAELESWRVLLALRAYGLVAPQLPPVSNPKPEP